jgi:hypothetical protein
MTTINETRTDRSDLSDRPESNQPQRGRRRTAAIVSAALIAAVVAGGAAGLLVTHDAHESKPAAATAPVVPVPAPHPVVPAGGGSVAPVRPVHPVQPVNPPSPQVETLQRQLAQLNYYAGPIDGYTGPQTQQALRNFQAWAHTQSWGSNVRVTGQLDGPTQAAINYALAHGDNQMGA